jgi:hypothetical protein
MWEVGGRKENKACGGEISKTNNDPELLPFEADPPLLREPLQALVLFIRHTMVSVLMTEYAFAPETRRRDTVSIPETSVRAAKSRLFAVLIARAFPATTGPIEWLSAQHRFVTAAVNCLRISYLPSESILPREAAADVPIVFSTTKAVFHICSGLVPLWRFLLDVRGQRLGTLHWSAKSA